MVWFRRIRNLKRRILRKSIGFVHLTIEGDIPVVREPVSFLKRRVLPQPDYTILELRDQSQQLIDTGRVRGLLIDLRQFNGELATIESLRDLVTLWQERELPVWIYSNSYSFSFYYLAIQADKIFLTPGGTLNTIGLSISASFYKSYFEEKGFEVQIAQVTPYKSALNSFGYDEMPEEQRENLNWLADGVFDQIIREIASTRNKSKEEVLAMIDNSPLTDDLATDQDWVDGNFSSIDIKKMIDEEFGVDVVGFDDAIGRIPMPRTKKPNIGIIPVIGTIVDGKSRDDTFPIPIPILGDRTAGDYSITQLIRKVRDTDTIKAAILLVNSPGGSATASEVILRELKNLSRKMPIVVYFHDVAASGGYYISMASDYIIAQPLTLTASIGVINGKFSTDKFYEDRDINRVIIKRGENSDIQGTVGKWDDRQIEIIYRSINRVYDLFKQHVSENRDIPIDELDQLAGGRVFVGHQGKERRLVDELGGIELAIEKAAQLADIDQPIAAVLGTEDKFKAPEELPFPEVIHTRIRQLSGRPQLLPYYILDDLTG